MRPVFVGRFDREVLEFRAVYNEQVRTEAVHAVGETPSEEYDITVIPHNCILRYFVQDSTLEIYELPVENSGRTEFRLVIRQQLAKPGK